MHHPPDRIAHTTTFVTPVVEHWLERRLDIRLRLGLGSGLKIGVGLELVYWLGVGSSFLYKV